MKTNNLRCIKTIIASFCVAFCFSGEAQLLDLSTIYRSNMQIINPAAINRLRMMDDYKSTILNVTGRYQWLGQNIEGSPLYGTFRYEQYLDNEHGNTALKFGLFGTGVQTGAITTTRVQGNIAAVIALDGRGRTNLSVGANAGWIGNSIDVERLRFASGTTYTPDDVFSQGFLDVSVGVFFNQRFHDLACLSHEWEQLFISEYYLGISVPQATGALVPFSKIQQGNIYVAPQRSISVIAGALFPLSLGSRTRSFLEASIWARNVPGLDFSTFLDEGNSVTTNAELSNLPFSMDTNLRLVYGEIFWLGAGYSTQKMMHTEVGLFVKDTDGGYINSKGLFLSNIGISYSFPVAWDSPFLNFLEVNIGFGWGN